YGEGISREGELINMGVDAGLIQRSGAWYSCDDQRIGQGKENARQFRKENPAIAERIEGVLREKFVQRAAGEQDDEASDKDCSREAAGAPAPAAGADPGTTRALAAGAAGAFASRDHPQAGEPRHRRS